jgi:hypothetical protein
MTRNVWILLFVFCLLAVLSPWLSSGSPDGMERVATDLGALSEEGEATSSVWGDALRAGLAVLVMMALLVGLGRLLRRSAA